MASDRETDQFKNSWDLSLASIEKKASEKNARRGDNMSDYLVPGSIRLDSRLIEEKEKQRGKRRRRKKKSGHSRYVRASMREEEEEKERERRRMIDVECRDMHNPVNIQWKWPVSLTTRPFSAKRLTCLLYIFWCDNYLNRDDRISCYDEIFSTIQSLFQKNLLLLVLSPRNSVQAHVLNLDRKQTLTSKLLYTIPSTDTGYFDANCRMFRNLSVLISLNFSFNLSCFSCVYTSSFVFWWWCRQYRAGVYWQIQDDVHVYSAKQTKNE